MVKRIPVLTLGVGLLLGALPLFAAGVQLHPSKIAGVEGIQLAADFNGDGLDDLFIHDKFQYNLGGRFGPPMDVNGIPASNPDHQDVGVVGAADFTGDGFADLFVARENANDVLLVSSGSGTFTAKGLAMLDGYGREVVDFTGDGIADLLTWKPGQLLLYRNNGNATFTLHQTVPWEEQFYQPSLPTADLNGDGRLDLVLRTDNSVVFLYAQPDGQFLKQERFVRFGPSYMTVGDLNGDGKLDIGYLSLATDRLAVSALYGDGTGRFPGYSRLVLSSGTRRSDDVGAHDITIGDFVPGGAQELAFGTMDGQIVVLSGANEQLREVGRTQIQGTFASVRKMRYRSTTPELVGVATQRQSTDYLAWVIDADGSIDSAQPRSRTRAMNRVVPVITTHGTFRLDVESDCPIPALTEFSFEREGVFVNFATSNVIQVAKAAYLPGELYVELHVKDGETTRVLTGSLTPMADRLTGKLFEWKPSPCGRWSTHRITATATQ